jgi:hypothetical protein
MADAVAATCSLAQVANTLNITYVINSAVRARLLLFFALQRLHSKLRSVVWWFALYC